MLNSNLGITGAVLVTIYALSVGRPNKGSLMCALVPLELINPVNWYPIIFATIFRSRVLCIVDQAKFFAFLIFYFLTFWAT